MEQIEMLKLARKLGELEAQQQKIKTTLALVIEAANKIRDGLFAELAATGSPQEREEALVRLLSQVASDGHRSNLKVRRRQGAPRSKRGTFPVKKS